MTGLAWLIWAERAPLLQGLADLWIISDPVTPADAAVVLGGGLEVRPFAAAELYRRGLVRKVVVSDVAEDRAVKIGAIRGHIEANRQILLNLGVQADAIETFGASQHQGRGSRASELGRAARRSEAHRPNREFWSAPCSLDVSKRICRAADRDRNSIISSTRVHSRRLVDD